MKSTMEETISSVITESEDTKRKIKILMISENFSYIGGVEGTLSLLATYLNKERFELHFCVLRGTGGSCAKSIESCGYSITPLHLSDLYDPRYIFKIFKIFRLINQIQPDIIHTWDVDGNLLGRIPAILTRAPLIISHEVLRWDLRLNLIEKISNCFVKVSNMFLDPFTDITICNSKNVRLFRDKTGDDAKFRTCFQPLETAKFLELGKERTDHFNSNEHPKLGIVARLDHQKGHKYLLEAMPKVLVSYPSSKLYIVGIGREEKRLKELTKQLKIEASVKFVGELSHELPKFLASLDLFIHPSIYEGGGPRAVLEAMATGVPVIATAIAEIRETITHGKNGILVPPSNSSALSEAIIELLSNPSKAKRIGLEAHNFLKQDRFDTKVYIDEIESIYEELACHKLPSR